MRRRVIEINKLEAAARQLVTAAQLHFDEGDVLSIHTLAAAANQILSDLAKKRGQPTLMEWALLDWLSDKRAKEARAAMRKPQNYLKHADRDASDSFLFEPYFTELLLLEAMASFRALKGEAPQIFEAFRAWFFMRRPSMWNCPSLRKTYQEAQREVGHLSRRDFLEQFLSASSGSL